MKELLPNNLRLLFLILPFLLVGCAGQTRFAQPPDFPLHATDHPFFDLHWRLERQEGAVQAVGLVEAARVSGIAEVTLELQGLDKDGRVVSHGRGHTYAGGPLFQGQTQPFSVRLRPTGQEVRFELKVWELRLVYGWGGDPPKVASVLYGSLSPKGEVVLGVEHTAPRASSSGRPTFFLTVPRCSIVS